jgi:hypothetical protein
VKPPAADAMRRSRWPHLSIISRGKECTARVDLAAVLGRLCQREWGSLGGSERELNLHLDLFLLEVDRTALIVEAFTGLLRDGLSPGFSAATGGIGVHLWTRGHPAIEAILLIADSYQDIIAEPATPGVARAYECALEAGCRLLWVPSRGALWRLHIPADECTN